MPGSSSGSSAERYSCSDSDSDSSVSISIAVWVAGGGLARGAGGEGIVLRGMRSMGSGSGELGSELSFSCSLRKGACWWRFLREVSCRTAWVSEA